MAKLKADFLDWLRNKATFEYWNGEITYDGYALQQKNRLIELASKKELFPRAITLFLTNRCNLLCEHCGQNSSKALPDELSLDEILELIPKLLELKVKYVSFSGGEPFLREDIFEIIKAFKNNGFIVGVISNGLISNQKLLNKIADSDLDSINVSIDGLKETHNTIRKNPKSFDLAMQFLLFASTQTRISMTSVTTCVSPNSLPELEDLGEAIFSHGARSWVLRPISPTGRAAFNNHLFLSDDEMKSLIDFCVGKVQKGIDLTLSYDVGFLGKQDSILRMSPYFSGLGWDTFQICANGDVKGLSEENVPVEGNIRERDLVEIWQNEFKIYRNYTPSQTCQSCDYLGRCGGEFIPNSFTDQSCLVPRGTLE